MNLQDTPVLIAPLNWGLGHASRCIPIIRQLIAHGAKITLASDGQAGTWLQNELPDLKYLELPSYKIHYRKGPVCSIIRQIPKIRQAIQLEHQSLLQYLKIHPQSILISDNRYGIYHRDSLNILITHQLNLYKPRWARPLFENVINQLIKPFQHIWIPDFNNRVLTGILSMSTDPRIRFIDPLSRFSQGNSIGFQYDLAIVLSGPEPSRKHLEQKIIKQINTVNNLRIILVRGTVDSTFYDTRNPGITIKNLVQSDELARILTQSSQVLCRSGYSSIMDLCKMNKTALLIPTPGQPEQEYLAHRMKSLGFAHVISQHDFDLKKILQYRPDNAWPVVPEFQIQKHLQSVTK